MTDAVVDAGGAVNEDEIESSNDDDVLPAKPLA